MSSVLINQEALREQYPREYVGEPMPSIAAGVIIIVIGRPIANVVKNIPNHISKKL